MKRLFFAIVATAAIFASCQNTATETPVTTGTDSTAVDSTVIVADSSACATCSAVDTATVSK